MTKVKIEVGDGSFACFWRCEGDCYFPVAHTVEVGCVTAEPRGQLLEAGYTRPVWFDFWIFIRINNLPPATDYRRVSRGVQFSGSAFSKPPLQRREAA